MAATVVLARRAREDREILAWLAVLVLATLRSPFLPQAYGAVPAALAADAVRGDARAHGAHAPAHARRGALVLAHYEPQDWPDGAAACASRSWA